MNADGAARLTVADIAPVEFWVHGYRTGWDDHAAGRTHLLDDPPVGAGGDVTPIRQTRTAQFTTP